MIVTEHECHSFIAVCLVNKTTGDGAKNSMWVVNLFSVDAVQDYHSIS